MSRKLFVYNSLAEKSDRDYLTEKSPYWVSLVKVLWLICWISQFERLPIIHEVINYRKCRYQNYQSWLSIQSEAKLNIVSLYCAHSLFPAAITFNDCFRATSQFYHRNVRKIFTANFSSLVFRNHCTRGSTISKERECHRYMNETEHECRNRYCYHRVNQYKGTK
jgi:hypothetical protein